MKFLLVFLLSFWMISCAVQRPKVYFDPMEEPKAIASSLAISLIEDPANVRMDLQTEMLKQGYSISSATSNEKTENILNYSYNYFYDDNGNLWLNGFWAEIIKRETGKVILSVSYPPGNFKKHAVLKNFLIRLNLCVQEKICDERSQEKRIKPLDRIVGRN